MLSFIFPNEKYLKLLAEMDKLTVEASNNLLLRLGVKSKQEKKVILLAVAPSDTLIGCNALLTLAEKCEEEYKKKIDLSKMKIVSLRSLDAASKSPYLERASFIFFPEEDLLSVENYPELENILPFHEK